MTVSQTFVVDAPFPPGTVQIYAIPHRTSVAVSTAELGIILNGVTTTDSATEDQEIDINYQTANLVWQFTLDQNGNATFTTEPSQYPIPIGNIVTAPYLEVNTTTRRIEVRNLFGANYSPIGGSQGRLLNTSLVYTEPVTDSLIIGFNTGDDDLYIDFLSNAGSYNQELVIGYVKIDEDNKVRSVYFDQTYLQSKTIQDLGPDGDITLSSISTLKVWNGKIIGTA